MCSGAAKRALSPLEARPKSETRVGCARPPSAPGNARAAARPPVAPAPQFLSKSMEQAEGLSRHFSEGKVRTADKHTERCESNHGEIQTTRCESNHTAASHPLGVLGREPGAPPAALENRVTSGSPLAPPHPAHSWVCTPGRGRHVHTKPDHEGSHSIAHDLQDLDTPPRPRADACKENGGNPYCAAAHGMVGSHRKE